jgi:hypothetical protein
MNVRLRKYPYPYRGLLALASDLDGTRSAEDYLQLLTFLNTTRATPMGDGIGIEFANSLYFDTTETQFSYWNADERMRDILRTLIGSGHIDALHSLGGQARTRARVARTLDEIERRGLAFPIFSNHSTAPTNFRSEHSNCSGSGDDPDAGTYHADRTIASGVAYVWLAQTTSVMAQEVRPDPLDVICAEHRLTSLATAARQTAKLLRGRWSPKYAMHTRNHILRETRLADGQPVLEFLRSNAHWAGIRRGESGLALDQVLRPAALDRLVEAGGSTVVYTHLGKRPAGATQLLSGATIDALRRLADCERSGHLLVLTTARALDYCALARYLEWHVEDGREATIVHLRLSCGEPLRSRLKRFLPGSGLSLLVDGAGPVRLVLDGEHCGPLTRHPPDATGAESISLPLCRPAFPELGP